MTPQDIGDVTVQCPKASYSLLFPSSSAFTRNENLCVRKPVLSDAIISLLLPVFGELSRSMSKAALCA